MSYNLYPWMGTPSPIPALTTKICTKCGVKFQTPAPNRKPICDDCKRGPVKIAKPRRKP